MKDPTKQIAVTETTFAEIDRLHKAAEKRVIASPTKFVVGGVGVFGLLVGSIGMPAAAACAFPLFYGAIKRAIQNGDNAAYMRETGIFAHLLTERELVKLTQLVGKDVVAAQLKEANDDGKALSGDALDYLDLCGGSAPIDLKTLLGAADKLDKTATTVPIREAREATIVLPAPALQPEPTPAPQPLYGANWQATPKVQPTDLALQLAERLTSRIICAAPRTGKGLLIYNALQHLRRIRPDVELWALDIKADPGENGYYQGFDPARLLRINLMGFSKPEGADERIQAFFQAYNNSTAVTKLLWINESVTLAAKLEPSLWKQIQQFAIGLCSAGSTGNDGQTGRFIWFDTQSPNVSDIGLKTNASRNVFRRVFLVNHDRSLLSSAVSCGFAAPIPEAKFAELQAVAKVVAYDSLSDTWVALPHAEPPSAISGDEMGTKLISLEGETTRNGTKAEMDARNKLETLYQSGSDAQEIPVSRFVSSSETPVSREMDTDRAARIREMRNQKLTQTAILAIEWRVAPGSSKAYQEAVAEYKAICEWLDSNNQEAA